MSSGSAQTIQVVVEPLMARADPTTLVPFAAQVLGSQVASVVWSVSEPGGGTIDGAGNYTAPQALGTYHVTAVAVADGKASSTATVIVGAGPGTGGVRVATTISTAGGGAMPSLTSNVVTAACDGTGATDATSCLQAAASTAAAQQKTLLIPATSGYYKITAPITVSGSVIGTGSGMPTIQQTNSSWTATGSVLRLAAGMKGWIYNLHLVGGFPTDGSIQAWQGGGEWAHNIDVGAVAGVTIKGNLLENARGDAIGNDAGAGADAAVAQDVLIDGNTMRNPYRMGVCLLWTNRWVITNNVIDKQVNYVSGIDFEPEGQSTWNVEVAYNKFVMNNRAGPGQPNGGRYGSDGRAASAWQNAKSPAPGGNLYLHDNYGTFGTGWWMSTISYLGGNGGWGTIVQSNNVEGTAAP